MGIFEFHVCIVRQLPFTLCYNIELCCGVLFICGFLSFSYDIQQYVVIFLINVDQRFSAGRQVTPWEGISSVRRGITTVKKICNFGNHSWIMSLYRGGFKDSLGF